SLYLLAPSHSELYSLSLHVALPILIRMFCAPLPHPLHGRGPIAAAPWQKGISPICNSWFLDQVLRQYHRFDESMTERGFPQQIRSEEHTSELQSHLNLVCRLLLEKI